MHPTFTMHVSVRDFVGGSFSDFNNFSGEN
jgi:hypothetical protein